MARLAGEYMQLAEDGKWPSAALIASWFLEDFGLDGWADLCAFVVHTAVSACPREFPASGGRVDAARLVADRLSLPERRRVMTGYRTRIQKIDGTAVISAPVEHTEDVLATAARARDLVRRAAAAGPGLGEIHAVLASGLTAELTSPVLMYAILAARNAGLTPEGVTRGRAAETDPEADT